MNSFEQHPDSELLDRLRAGLVDDKRQRAELETHLAGCESCRRRYEWPAQLTADTTAVDRQLDQLRQRALEAPATRRPHRLLPLAAAAAIALVAVALFNLLPETDSPPAQLAENGSDIPDVYEDLDFYLWLADHKATDDPST